MLGRPDSPPTAGSGFGNRIRDDEASGFDNAGDHGTPANGLPLCLSANFLPPSRLPESDSSGAIRGAIVSSVCPARKDFLAQFGSLTALLRMRSPQLICRSHQRPSFLSLASLLSDAIGSSRSLPSQHCREEAFKREHPCPATGRSSGRCPGYVIDHVNPLECGGADAPYNTQWQTVAQGKAKDKTERNCRL